VPAITPNIQPLTPQSLLVSYNSGVSLRLITRVFLTVVCLLIAGMWVYAFGFAPRESINRVRDHAWAARQEAVCKSTNQARSALAELTKLNPKDTAQLAHKAELIDKATDQLDAMLEKIREDKPTDAKGQAIVPAWLADYEIYIKDRRDYAQLLRSGKNGIFTESMSEGIPITEKLGTFARDNHMDSCVPPLDLEA
jgi:hypothetical protein